MSKLNAALLLLLVAREADDDNSNIQQNHICRPSPAGTTVLS